MTPPTQKPNSQDINREILKEIQGTFSDSNSPEPHETPNQFNLRQEQGKNRIEQSIPLSQELEGIDTEHFTNLLITLMQKPGTARAILFKLGKIYTSLESRPKDSVAILFRKLEIGLNDLLDNSQETPQIDTRKLIKAIKEHVLLPENKTTKESNQAKAHAYTPQKLAELITTHIQDKTIIFWLIVAQIANDVAPNSIMPNQVTQEQKELIKKIKQYAEELKQTIITREPYNQEQGSSQQEPLTIHKFVELVEQLTNTLEENSGQEQ